jgi:hypothetical protein
MKDGAHLQGGLHLGGIMTPLHRILLVSLFAIAFAFVESTIVVYLRALYYPEGLTFPLTMINPKHLVVELMREMATIIMLIAVGVIAGGKRWEKFGYALVAFGLWDIFYYVWLKVTLNWPRTLMDWDVLFLIPVPWLGPVIAPVVLALFFVVSGAMMVTRSAKGLHFQPRLSSHLLSIIATIAVIYSFTHESPAVLQGRSPSPYPYGLLIVSLVLYLAGFLLACRDAGRTQLSQTH